MEDNKKTKQTSQDNSDLGDKDIDIEDLQEKIEKLKKDELESQMTDDQEDNNLTSKLDEQNDQYARLLAEFDNYKKRTREESSRLMNMGAIGILKVVVSFFEDFNRAAGQCPEGIQDSDFWKGISLIEANFIRELEKKGLKKIKALSEKFDSSKMEALMQDPNVANDEVAKVLEEGFEYEGGIVKVAKVIVGARK